MPADRTAVQMARRQPQCLAWIAVSGFRTGVHDGSVEKPFTTVMLQKLMPVRSFPDRSWHTSVWQAGVLSVKHGWRDNGFRMAISLIVANEDISQFKMNLTIERPIWIFIAPAQLAIGLRCCCDFLYFMHSWLPSAGAINCRNLSQNNSAGSVSVPTTSIRRP